MTRKLLAVLVLLFSTANMALAQSPFDAYEHLFTMPKNYVVGFSEKAPNIDGDITDDAWKHAVWTDHFTDIEGDAKPKPYYNTRVKMLWDYNYLYFAAEMEEPHVWAKLDQRDQVVFYDNDFEIFIDPLNTTHQYFEVEINALNNIFDLFMPRPYLFGGLALISWNSPGMKHAVKINGTLNDASDVDKGWTVEIAIPFSAITIGNTSYLPKDEEIWRLNFSRVEWRTNIINGEYMKQKDGTGNTLPELNWVWSPQGVIDMHQPERWGYLQFSKKEASEKLAQFELPYQEKQRRLLWLLHYKQMDYRKKHGKFAHRLEDLDMQKLDIKIDGIENEISLSATDHQYRAWIKDKDGRAVSINQEGLVK